MRKIINKFKHVITSAIITVTTGITSLGLISPSWAGVYSFGEGCGSLGGWSQAALSQTREIIRIAEAIKEDPNCKGLETIVPQLKLAQTALDTPDANRNRTDRLESIPTEISALRDFSVTTPEVKSNILRLVAAKTIEGATLATKVAPSVVPGGSMTAGAVAQELEDLLIRTNRAAKVGVDALNGVFTILPSYDKCLMGHPDQGLALFSASVKLAAAFASSQEGLMSKLGTTLSGLTTMVRNRKFSQRIRELNENEFWLSMSCLLETTTMTYCKTQDAHRLLRFGIKSIKPRQTSQDEALTTENPLEGYYLLMRDIPIVSEWLQKIQFGIRPKLSTDASFKNKAWADVTNLYMSVNSVYGIFSEEMLTYSTLTDDISKKNAILNILRKMVNYLSHDGNDRSSGVNFFTMTVIDQYMPFFLIGLQSIPEEAASNKKGGFIMPWDIWMQDGGRYVAQFDHPDELARSIESKLDELIASALSKASLFFQQRLIVDLSNLVNESVTSQTFTVYQSLRRVSAYIARLEKRIANVNDDIVLLPSLRDTRRKLDKVIKGYDTIRELVAQQDAATLSNEQFKATYQDFLTMVYDEFNILLQRDTFLSTRISTFVKYDYAMRIKRREDITPFERELLVESGRHLIERIMGGSSDNPAALLNDLNSAQVVNKRNLQTFEGLFRNSMYPMMEELKLIASGHPLTNKQMNGLTLGRLYRDAHKKYYGPEAGAKRYLLLPLNMFFPADLMTTWFQRLKNPDLYPYRSIAVPTFRGVDDEFGSFDQFRAKICIQTLAFEDRKFFEPLCKGATLKSAFDMDTAEEGKDEFKLDARYDDYTTRNGQIDRPVTSNSICAFRDYNRHNLVYWLTLDLADTY